MDKDLVLKVVEKASSFLSGEQTAQIIQLFFDEIDGMAQRSEKNASELTESFLKAKKVEGCSYRTVRYYQYVLADFFKEVAKKPNEITTEDIRSFLNSLFEKRMITNVSADNTRRILSSFFAWLSDEDYLLKNPMKRIHKIKALKLVKEPFSDEAIEKIVENCASVRNLAIVELLESTGMRVGELTRINKQDVDFENKEILVLGKGGKQRRVYFDTKTKLHIGAYLASRLDNSPALFESAFHPFNRLEISGVEMMLRKVGQRASVANVHPHRFRRTLATKAIDKGMPVEQVQILLGHAKIDTTLRYAIVDQRNVKNSYHRYLE
jgi:integrase/recombinase XerD